MATFKSKFSIGDRISFKKPKKQDYIEGQIIAITFTKYATFYDILEEKFAGLCKRIDSADVIKPEK